ncbi:inner membrane protein YiaA [Conchiformibius kuhniae]|uniref:Inner membrane protein YiaA n=1 Tax=Conchiformibius kuhniae TaxID=211502 RepID=A0A8T9MSD5_9NEIS|nr:inner membrane protein YiaA [Conchiformibius kuhniae]UOP04810.1 hypothetical protein LVJ77_11810 [Conchiformibius kuhniae]
MSRRSKSLIAVEVKDLVQCRPTAAFVGASWAALALGATLFLFGLWNAPTLALSEKGFYFCVLLLGLYAAVSLQKSLRDREEGLPVSALYHNISWAMLGMSAFLMLVGLWNAALALSEKGFYGIAFAMSLFAVITIQKNTRDTRQIEALLRQAPYHDDGMPASEDV